MAGPRTVQRSGLLDALPAAPRPPGEPAWRTKRRDEALAILAERGFPTARDEAWKYTNPEPFAAAAWAPVAAPARVEPAALRRFALDGVAGLLVTVDGHFAPALSRAPQGVQAGSLASEEGSRTAPSRFGRFASRDHAFVALNEALAPDGVAVRFARGADPGAPVHVLHVASGAASSLASPRTLVVVEDGAAGSVVEHVASLGPGRSLVNAVTEVDVGADARLDHTRVQELSRDALLVHVTGVAQGRGSGVVARSYDAGGARVRGEVHQRFLGEGGDLQLDGLFLGRGEQHVDNQTRVDHAVPRCASRQFYKGILDDRGRGVFRGLVWIRPGAQQTNASQSNKNLLLSREALVDSVPALDIRADDVKASHGSTIGQLEEPSLFYLRSRGLGEAEARSLLTHAFGAETLESLKFPALRDRLDRMLHAWLPGGSA